MREIKLKSLAPEFNGDDHDLYVRHLEEAVKDSRNRNIALTGRYGAGKSSVLDKFEENHAAETVRISINTLGPDDDDEDLTNRIQKELVKQLVYRLRPGQVRRSRFARPKPLTHGRAFVQALGIAGIGLTLLWLFGVRPANGWPGEDLTSDGKVLLGAAFFGLVLFGVWAIRWAIGDRFVSEVSTAGTKIALSEGPTTYFDSYLDEIVSFFEAVEPRYVIFEDLDRFDDPQIFESLRELNTLINASAYWKEKDQPLHFVYAIKDSLFERLGADSRQSDDPVATEESTESEAVNGHPLAAKTAPDYAAEAVRRANRTKFFEIVIPIVPFLSHRNARDHLSNALAALGFPKDFVSRPLLDLVARYTTDMRLMINICNEFAVFVERLLWNENPAPGMTSDDLFALVTYKNFHLADFEDIAQRASSLDDLEQFHHDEVRALVNGLQARRRQKLRTEELRTRKKQTAALLGERLRKMASLFQKQNNWTYDVVIVDGRSFSIDTAEHVELWETVVRSQSVILRPQRGNDVVLDADVLAELFPEATQDVNDWIDPDPAELARILRDYSDDIIMLKGADFAELSKYKGVPTGRTPFKERINDVLKSDLARELVLKGFITRNYAEYSSMFYGSFVGVDVAYFYNHSVQPNEMYIDFHFTSKGAVRNLLEQVPEDFASTDSALNIEVVEYLLTNRPQEAEEIAAYIVANDTRTEVQAFLSAYFNTPDSSHATLIGLLSAHPWRQVFEYVAGHPELPDDETRLSMFDAAVLEMREIGSYEIGAEASEFLRINYPRMRSVSNEHSPAQIEKVSDLFETIAFVVPDLSFLSRRLRVRIVAAHLYEIRVSNLKLALGSDEVPCLDEVRKNEDVWEYCRSRISEYIQAMDIDTTGECLIRSEQVLIEISNEQIEQWSDDELRAVVKGSTANATIAEFKEVPEQIWPMLVQYHRVSPSAANVQTYTNAFGIDEGLASFLSPDNDHPIALQNVDDMEADTRTQLAVSLLNASARLSARERVALAVQLNTDDGLNLADITPAPDQLLARGLEAGIFKDDLGTFTHFAPGGWAAMSDAFMVSSKVSTFMAPAIVQGFVADFLNSSAISKNLKKLVLEDLSRYVPNEDALALGAAGEFAKAESIKLPLEEVRRVARVTKDPSITMRQLVLSWNNFGPDQAVEILSSLGAPYDKLVAGPGTTFDYPSHVTSIDTVLKYLEQAGRIKVAKRAIGRGKVVEVLI